VISLGENMHTEQLAELLRKMKAIVSTDECKPESVTCPHCGKPILIWRVLNAEAYERTKVKE